MEEYKWKPFICWQQFKKHTFNNTIGLLFAIIKDKLENFINPVITLKDEEDLF